MPDLQKIIDDSKTEIDDIEKHFLDNLISQEVLPYPKLVRYLLVEYISFLYQKYDKDQNYVLAKYGKILMTPLYLVIERETFIDSLMKLGYCQNDLITLKRDIQLSRVYLERKTGLIKRDEDEPPHKGITPFYFILPRSDTKLNQITNWYNFTAVKKRSIGIKRTRKYK